MKQTKLFLFVLMLLAPMCGWAEEQGYAVYDPANRMLTFKYGEKPSGDYIYDTDDTFKDFKHPDWLEHNKTLETVIFDKSFAKARPKSTSDWFAYYIYRN